MPRSFICVFYLRIGTTTISYHASQEHFTSSDLLKWVIKAEESGFKRALSSDHFHPWNHTQGASGFAWSWLVAAMARIDFSYGVINASGQRYHPAIIAQASAKLAQMFPDRFWLVLGSGQAINEKITGTQQQRNERLKECVYLIRALWNGETVNLNGLVPVEDAKL